jgi:hypothetical protein
MEEALRMDILDSRDSLVGDKQDSLKRESSAVVVKQILERQTEEVVDKYIVIVLLPELVYLWDSDPSI